VFSNWGIQHDKRSACRSAEQDGSFVELPAGLIPDVSIPNHETQVTIPIEANVIARRKSFGLFGNGLVEAVPDEILMGWRIPTTAMETHQRSCSSSHDKATNRTRIGRFGWKAQQATLLAFAPKPIGMKWGSLMPF